MRPPKTEVIWLRRLLTDVGVPPEGPTIIHGDNQGAIAMAKNPVGHARTNHIGIRYHFVREGVQNGAIVLKYIATDDATDCGHANEAFTQASLRETCH